MKSEPKKFMVVLLSFTADFIIKIHHHFQYFNLHSQGKCLIYHMGTFLHCRHEMIPLIFEGRILVKTEFVHI